MDDSLSESECVCVCVCVCVCPSRRKGGQREMTGVFLSPRPSLVRVRWGYMMMTLAPRAKPERDRSFFGRMLIITISLSVLIAPRWEKIMHAESFRPGGSDQTLYGKLYVVCLGNLFFCSDRHIPALSLPPPYAYTCGRLHTLCVVPWY